MTRKDIMWITTEALAASLGRTDGAHVAFIEHDYGRDVIKIGFRGGATGIETNEGVQAVEFWWDQEFDEHGQPTTPGRWHPRR